MNLDAVGPKPGPGGETPAHERLRRACQGMEALFLQKLFETMRESVPEEEGFFSRSEGEKLFTAMLDEQLAGEASETMERGLAEAMYRQLARRIGGGGES